MKKHKDLNNIIPFSQNFIHSTLFEKLKVDIFLKPVLMNAAKSKILEKKKWVCFVKEVVNKHRSEIKVIFYSM